MVSKKGTIDYERLVQEALRNVVRDVLQVAAKNGLPGSHHFYISFATDHPHVDMPDYLKELYPDEITIVLQHEYWDLVVEDHAFAVTLCFNDSNERLMVPFDALISFVDPSVKFGLQFTPQETISGPQRSSVLSKTPPETALTDPLSEDGSNVVTVDFFRKK